MTSLAGFSLGSPDHMRLSPNRDRLVVLERKPITWAFRLDYVDTVRARCIRSVDLDDIFAPCYDKRRDILGLEGYDVNWERRTCDLWVSSSLTREIAKHFRVNLETGERTEIGDLAPWPAGISLKDPRLMDIRYALGVHCFTRTEATLSPDLRRICCRILEKDLLSGFPKPPEKLFLSPDYKYLVSCWTEKEDPEAETSRLCHNLRVQTLEDGKIIMSMQPESAVADVVFAQEPPDEPTPLGPALSTSAGTSSATASAKSEPFVSPNTP